MKTLPRLWAGWMTMETQPSPEQSQLSCFLIRKLNFLLTLSQISLSTRKIQLPVVEFKSKISPTKLRWNNELEWNRIRHPHSSKIFRSKTQNWKIKREWKWKTSQKETEHKILRLCSFLFAAKWTEMHTQSAHMQPGHVHSETRNGKAALPKSTNLSDLDEISERFFNNRQILC